MIWTVAWKNIWRNKVRSIVVITAITIGLFGGTFAAALMNGMVMRRVHSAIEQEVSHIQLHNAQFLANKDPEFTISSPSEMVRKIEETPGVEAVSTRLITLGMASTARKNSGVQIVGISPSREGHISEIQHLLLDTTSSYFEGVVRRPVLVGKQLAEKMNLKVNSKLLLTLQGIDGYQTGGSFRVVGIYKADNATYNETNVFVQQSDLCKLTGFAPDAAHEIAVLLTDIKRTDEVKTALSTAFPDTMVESFIDLAPDLAMTAQYMDTFMLFLISIVLLALGFGIVNTMLMVVLERIREFGMLMAIGMNKRRVFSLIVLETVYLIAFGGLLGMSISYFLTLYYGQVGIDISSYAEGLEAIGYAPVLRPEIGFRTYLSISGLVIITGVLASIYPALKAIRLNPSEAIRSV